MFRDHKHFLTYFFGIYWTETHMLWKSLRLKPNAPQLLFSLLFLLSWSRRQWRCLFTVQKLPLSCNYCCLFWRQRRVLPVWSRHLYSRVASLRVRRRCLVYNVYTYLFILINTTFSYHGECFIFITMCLIFLK